MDRNALIALLFEEFTGDVAVDQTVHKNRAKNGLRKVYARIRKVTI